MESKRDLGYKSEMGNDSPTPVQKTPVPTRNSPLLDRVEREIFWNNYAFRTRSTIQINALENDLGVEKDSSPKLMFLLK